MSVERNSDDGADRLVGKLSEIIGQRVETDKLVLPCLPAAGRHCTRLLRDGELAAPKLVDAVARDPILAAQVLRLANASGAPVVSIEQAVARLEAARLKGPLAEMAARQTSESQSRAIADAARAIWRHSLAVALLARDLAALAQTTSGDEAYTAGLLHDVGELVLAGMLLEAERHLSHTRGLGWIRPAQWTSAVKQRHRAIGQLIADKWGLPPAAQRCARDVLEYEAGDRTAAVNFVIFANALAKRLGLYHGSFDADDAAALEVIGRSMLGLQEGVVNALAAGIGDRVDALLV